MAKEHRTLRFGSLEEAIAEAERLAILETRTTGNFSFGQILEHLARSFELSIGERKLPPPPLLTRTLARIGRPLVLRKASTGFKLPSNSQDVLWPTEEVTVEQGISHLREASKKFQAATEFPTHAFFGSMDRGQHETLHTRHFEAHLGFVHEA